MTMNERLERYRRFMEAQGWSPDTTITDRLELLRRVVRDLGDLRGLTVDQIEGWLGRKEWKANTKVNYFHHINAYYVWEVRRGVMVANPLAVIDKKPRARKGKPRPTRVRHWERIVAEAEPKWRLCALLAGLAGLRACEISRLRRRDVDEELITIIQGKGGKDDDLPTHPLIWEAVRGLPPGLLVRNRHGLAYTPAALSGMFAVYCRVKLDINTSLHPLRHRFCTDLRNQTGGNMLAVKEAARHESLQTTQIYTEVEHTEIRDAIRSLDPRNRRGRDGDPGGNQNLRPAA